MRRADSRAICTAGNSKATSTPIMAMTTSSSTSVNPPGRRLEQLCMKRSSTVELALKRRTQRKMRKGALRGRQDRAVFFQVNARQVGRLRQHFRPQGRAIRLTVAALKLVG